MTNNKIKIQNGKLDVPDNPIIPFIQGDGIGIDIWPATRKVIDAAVEKCYQDKRKINWLEVLAGEKAFKQTGNWLPKETLEAFQQYLVGIKGPLTTPVGGGIRSLNVTLRQELDLYVCLRPIAYFPGAPSPIKNPELVDMVIFRENTEDIYAGIEFMNGTADNIKVRNFLIDQMGVKKIRFPESSSFGIKPVSREGSERLIRAAIQYAIRHKLPSVTIVHKGNIMKFTEGAFKIWGYELAESEFADKVFTWNQWEALKSSEGEDYANKEMEKATQVGKIIIKDTIADAFLQEALMFPQRHSVIATLNLNGDYISDMLAAMVGGIGIAPGGNINYTSGYAIFEATHGTAPIFAGKNMANPGSLLLSAAMMLNYVGWDEAAHRIHQTMQKTIANKTVTFDFYQFMDNAVKLSTSDFAIELIRNL